VAATPGTANSRADEIAQLKQQLSTLQAMVGALEQTPAEQPSNNPAPPAPPVTAQAAPPLQPASFTPYPATTPSLQPATTAPYPATARLMIPSTGVHLNPFESPPDSPNPFAANSPAAGFSSKPPFARGLSYTEPVLQAASPIPAAAASSIAIHSPIPEIPAARILPSEVPRAASPPLVRGGSPRSMSPHHYRGPSPLHTRPASPQAMHHGAGFYGCHPAQVMSPAMHHLRQRMSEAHTDVYSHSFDSLASNYHPPPVPPPPSYMVPNYRPRSPGRIQYGMEPPVIHSGGPPPQIAIPLPGYGDVPRSAPGTERSSHSPPSTARSFSATPRFTVEHPPTRSPSRDDDSSRLDDVLKHGLANSGAAKDVPTQQDLHTLYNRLDAQRVFMEPRRGTTWSAYNGPRHY